MKIVTVIILISIKKMKMIKQNLNILKLQFDFIVIVTSIYFIKHDRKDIKIIILFIILRLKFINIKIIITNIINFMIMKLLKNDHVV